ADVPRRAPRERHARGRGGPALRPGRDARQRARPGRGVVPRAPDHRGLTTVEYRDYLELQRRIAPGLRYNQDVYREQVESLVTPDTVWLDAGCGQRIFPAWRPLEDERNIVGRAKLVIGCDIDAPALRLHQTVRLLAVADLTRLMADAGLAEQSFRYLANDATVQNVWWLAALELAWIRLTLVHGLRGLRVSMVAVFTKPGARDPERRSIEAT